MSKHDFISQNKDVYNTIASYFSDTRQFVWDDLKSFSQYITKEDTVLDIGCGNGRVYQLCENLQVPYTGIDQSENLISIAREKNPGVRFGVGEMTELPYEDASFSVIICVATFNHLPDRDSRLKSLSEMKRVLKPGGIILMTNWNVLSDNAQKYIDRGKWEIVDGNRQDVLVPWLTPIGEKLPGSRYYHGYELPELFDLCIQSGFIVEQQYYSKKGKRSTKNEGHNIVSIIRNQWTGVPSAGGVVVRKEGEKYFVALERDTNLEKSDYWFIPKGHLDPGETLEEAARREISEEVGVIDLSYERFLIKTERKEYIGDEWKNMYYFLYTTEQIELQPKKAKAHDRKHEAKWIDLFQKEPISSFEEQESVFRMVRSIIKK
ncbi:MAG TPA: bifunctional class I SAM-dependent methyltransferase/NUDIX hydrolase [Candidatus Magasanikbacteria bacterium]|nr:bifunctional class I SAM-dependent methyltransferase/NUDIX hydrolase [Candidatus Magasanikbacteria bacterium]